MKRLFLLATCMLLLSGGAIAAPATQPEAKIEVIHLLEFVEQSTCEFNRNDTWYNGKDARQHLEMKYESLLGRGLIVKAEDFIDKAASQSSFSGRDYQIRCRDGKSIPSAQWLSAELQRYRKKQKVEGPTL